MLITMALIPNYVFLLLEGFQSGLTHVFIVSLLLVPALIKQLRSAAKTHTETQQPHMVVTASCSYVVTVIATPVPLPIKVVRIKGICLIITLFRYTYIWSPCEKLLLCVSF